MWSTSHLYSLPANCVIYQPSVGSTSHLWGLPVICGVYQSSVGSTSHLCGLQAICVIYQSSLGSVNHLWDLSAICGVYQSSMGSTSHLWSLPAICVVYQPSVVLIIGQILTHLQGHKNYSSEHFVYAINSFLIIIPLVSAVLWSLQDPRQYGKYKEDLNHADWCWEVL